MHVWWLLLIKRNVWRSRICISLTLYQEGPNERSATVMGGIIEYGLLKASPVQSFTNASCLPEEPMQQQLFIHNIHDAKIHNMH